MIGKNILLILSILITRISLSGQDIINIENPHECIIEINLEDLSIRPFSGGDQPLTRIDFKDHVPYGDSGDPLIPARVFLIALPPGMDGQVRVQRFDKKILHNTVPVPFETIIPGDDFSEYRHVLGPVYESAGPFPAGSFIVDETGYMGGQRIMRLGVFPVEYLPAEKTVNIYQRIAVRVQFVQSQTESEYTPHAADPVVKVSVVNADQVKKWPELPLRRSIPKTVQFSQGEWYKIPVNKEGLYRITGSMLSNAGADIQAINIETVKIYNNGGKMLPNDLAEKRPDGLIENPVWLNSQNENGFGAGDEILFYGRGLQHVCFDSTERRLSHANHLYATENYYWLVFNDGIDGKRWNISDFSPSFLHAFDTAEEMIFVEEDINNPIGTGIRWYGHEFNHGLASTLQRSYSLDFPGIKSAAGLEFRFRLASTASGSHAFSMALSGSSIGSVSLSNATVREFSLQYTGFANSENNTLSINYSYAGSQSIASSYLDWFQIIYKRNLSPHKGMLTFFSAKQEGMTAYRLSGFAETPLVLDVTKESNIRKLEIIADSGNLVFTDYSSDHNRRRYMAVERSGFLTPDKIEKTEIRDLRNSAFSADMIIISHPEFLQQAQRLADHRTYQDTISTTVFDINDIYYTFSCGLQDPVAIRDFVHHAVHNWPRPPRYLLLFGDGHYDYRNIVTDQPNFIPPWYQDGATFIRAAAKDDFYTYVIGSNRLMDLSTGRLTVQNPEQADIVVEKIIQYDSEPDWGSWKNQITLLADDERSRPGVDDEVMHVLATEYLVRGGFIPERFDIKKIYLTEYPEVVTAHGRRKPQAREAFINQINQGTVMVNYIGHGNSRVWTDERIFQRDMDIMYLNNKRRLPLFYGATCTFGHFDDINDQSLAEALFLADNKGAIASIGSVRESHASPNEALNRIFIQYLLNDAGKGMRIGDALRMAKTRVFSTDNNELYHIFGDPSMHLSIPVNNVYITEMLPDSLKALGITQVKGYVGSEEGIMYDFNGMVFLQSFDSRTTKTYTSYGGARTIEYDLKGNTLFRGEAEVNNGIFEMAFIVPKDISYRGDTGRLSAYAWSNDSDAGGFKGGISVGGSVDVHDTEGPEIRFEFEEDIEVFDGDIVNSPALLTAKIYDELTGINIAGEIGHKIMLSVNGEEEDVTDYFKYDPGSYLKGRLQYTLDFLEPGEHEIEIKAWDNANNSSQKPLYFQIVDGSSLFLERVLNYPNPMQASTHFTFTLNMDAEVDIKIYTVSGRMIRHLNAYYAYAGFNMIPWDGLDDMGDRPANGVYLYKLSAAAQTGTDTLKKEEIGRLMIMN